MSDAEETRDLIPRKKRKRKASLTTRAQNKRMYDIDRPYMVDA
jgi:hypothetical protein